MTFEELLLKLAFLHIAIFSEDLIFKDAEHTELQWTFMEAVGAQHL